MMKSLSLLLVSTLINLFAFSILFGQWADYSVSTANWEKSETAVFANPTSPNIAVSAWNDFRDVSLNMFSQGYAFSTNGGQSWASNVLGLPRNYTCAFDPSAVINTSGKAYLCYSAGYYALEPAMLGRIYSSSTTDNGQSWIHNPVSIDTAQQDKPWMTIDNTGGTRNGRIYVCWTDFANFGLKIRERASSDGGNSWSTECTVVDAVVHINNIGIMARYPAITQRPPTDSVFFVQCAMPAVAPNGDLFVAWMEGVSHFSGQSGAIRMARSTDGGLSFSNTNPPASSILISWDDTIGVLRAASSPAVAIDQTTGAIYVAYTTFGDVVWLTHSTNNGSSWSSPMQVTQSSGPQFFPALAVSPTHTVTLSYYEYYNSTVIVYAENSYDGGNSFYPVRQQLTPNGMNPSAGIFGCDYQTIVSPSINNHLAVWTDSRNSRFDVFAGLSNAPAPPKNPQLASNSGRNGPVRFSWNKNLESDVSSYEVSQAVTENGGTWSVVATTSDTFWVDPIYAYAPGAGDFNVSYRARAENTQSSFSPNSSVVAVRCEQREKINVSALSAENFYLYQCYPNPFNPTTNIKYDIKTASHVSLTVEDILGRRVAELVDRDQGPGSYLISWNTMKTSGIPISSGVYFARLFVTDALGVAKYTRTSRLLLMK